MPDFKTWQGTTENEWYMQDLYTQKMMFTMMYRGFNSK